MTLEDELMRLGYRFEYQHGDSEDRTEVWLNEKEGMAVRIEWMGIENRRWSGASVRRLHDHKEPPGAGQRGSG